MKHSKIIGLVIYAGLMAVCFMPWTYHADVQKMFDGFYSFNNTYGKPGKFFIIFSVICILCMWLNKVWAKFVHLFVAGIIVAYALKTYHLFTSSYNGYTPQKQWGIYLLVLFSILSFVIAMVPEEKSKKS